MLAGGFDQTVGLADDACCLMGKPVFELLDRFVELALHRDYASIELRELRLELGEHLLDLRLARVEAFGDATHKFAAANLRLLKREYTEPDGYVGGVAHGGDQLLVGVGKTRGIEAREVDRGEGSWEFRKLDHVNSVPHAANYCKHMTGRVGRRAANLDKSWNRLDRSPLPSSS